MPLRRPAPPGRHSAADRPGRGRRSGRLPLRSERRSTDRPGPLPGGNATRGRCGAGQIAHVDVARQPAQVAQEVVLPLRRLELDEAHVQPEVLRGSPRRDARATTPPRRPAPTGCDRAPGRSGRRGHAHESSWQPRVGWDALRPAYYVCVLSMGLRAKLDGQHDDALRNTHRTTHHARNTLNYTLNVLNRLPARAPTRPACAWCRRSPRRPGVRP